MVTVDILYDIEIYLNSLEFLKDNYSNKIPDEILHSSANQPKYKVRKNWFQAVTAEAENIILENYASEKSKELFQEYLEPDKNTEFSKRLTTKEDINKGDELLSSLIDDLKKYEGL
ncbi:MAG: hypothetical protein DRP06_01575 [Candidatus Aenigmatarchaeota archaeon]|nr:MAG: hypothetical protein DRP06_01575 [Candidatus Aenigmarchaeota archaeon]